MLLLAAPLLFLPHYVLQGSDNRDTPASLSADLAGNAYVGSRTGDGAPFLTKVSPEGRVLYRVAGRNGVPDPQGNLYALLPVNFGDDCAVKFDPAGNLVYKFCVLPGRYITALAVGPDGSTYFTGSWYPDAVKTTPGAWVSSARAAPNQANPFVIKLNPAGDAIVYSTFINNAPGLPGGAITDAYRIAVDAGGSAYVVGFTGDPGFPATPGTYQTECGCGPDTNANIFVAKLSPDGSSLSYSTFLDESIARFGPVRKTILDAAVDEAGALRVSIQALQYNGNGSPAFATALTGKQLSADGKLLSSTARSLPWLDGSLPASLIPFDPSTILLTGQADPAFAVSEGAFRAGDTFIALVGLADGAMRYAARLPYDPRVPTFAVPDGNGGFLFLRGTRQDISSVSNPAWLLSRFVPVSRPVPSVFGLANEAESDVSTAIAAGEVVTITGDGIGPVEPAIGSMGADGRLPFTLGGTEVFFNDTPAPILSVASQQVTAVAPFELGTTNPAMVRLRMNGVDGNPVYVTPAAAEPQMLHGPADSVGQVYAAALNEDGSVNCRDGNAAPGSILSVFVNGAGLLIPTPSDGTLGRVGQEPSLAISAFFRHHHMGNVPVEILYAGGSAGLVAGIVQVNFRLPPPPGPPAGPGQITVKVGDQITTTLNICVQR